MKKPEPPLANPESDREAVLDLVARKLDPIPWPPFRQNPSEFFTRER